MNKLSGTIIFLGRIDPFDFGFNVVYNPLGDGTHLMFVYGNTDFATSDDVVEALASQIDGDILDIDLSISTEDDLMLFNEQLFRGEYSVITFEGRDAKVDDVVKKIDKNDVIAIRESSDSEIFGNRKIKVDCLKPL